MERVTIKICGEIEEYVWLDGGLLRLSDLLDELHSPMSIVELDPAMLSKWRQPPQDLVIIEA